MTQQKKETIEKIGGEKNHEEFFGKHILGSLFMEIYLGILIHEIFIHENLFMKTYSRKLIQKYLFTKTHSRKQLATFNL